MSIWCSWEHIGTDPTVMYEIEPGVFEVDLGIKGQAAGREPVEQKAERGIVLSYGEGFSNHYPDLTGEVERPAVIGLSTIPAWCVPGNRDNFDYDELGPWVRLEVSAPESLNFWTKDGENPTTERKDATVILDEDAARALRDDLTAWLDRPKARPSDD